MVRMSRQSIPTMFRALPRPCYAVVMAKDTHVLERPPEGASADWTIPQDWEHYTAEEHATWDTLFARQAKLLPGRASEAYLKGFEALRLSESGIPNFEELSERLMKLTG